MHASWGVLGDEQKCLQKRDKREHYLTTRQLIVTDPGVRLPLLQLHTSKFTLFVVGYAAIDNPPVVAGMYPVTALIDPFGFHMMASVDAVPVAVVVTTVAHAVDEIELVPSAEVPLAIVWVEV